MIRTPLNLFVTSVTLWFPLAIWGAQVTTSQNREQFYRKGNWTTISMYLLSHHSAQTAEYNYWRSAKTNITYSCSGKNANALHLQSLLNLLWRESRLNNIACFISGYHCYHNTSSLFSLLLHISAVFSWKYISHIPEFYQKVTLFKKVAVKAFTLPCNLCHKEAWQDFGYHQLLEVIA